MSACMGTSWKSCSEKDGVYALCDGAILALRPEFYSDETGLCLEGENDRFLEV